MKVVVKNKEATFGVLMSFRGPRPSHRMCVRLLERHVAVSLVASSLNEH